MNGSYVFYKTVMEHITSCFCELTGMKILLDGYNNAHKNKDNHVLRIDCHLSNDLVGLQNNLKLCISEIWLAVSAFMRYQILESSHWFND